MDYDEEEIMQPPRIKFRQRASSNPIEVAEFTIDPDFHTTGISPRTSMDQAKQYIAKEQKKGFKFLELAQSNTETTLDRFWLKKEIVLSIRREIRKLPYYDSKWASIAEQFFLNHVKLICSHLHQTPEDQSKFESEVLMIRSKEISSLISQGNINTTLLPKNLKEEFNPSTNDDVNVFEITAKSVSKLPPKYQFSGYCMNDDSRAIFKSNARRCLNVSEKIISNELSHYKSKPASRQSLPIQPVRTNPQIFNKKVITSCFPTTQRKNDEKEAKLGTTMSSGQIWDLYWQQGDPLRSTREGNYISSLDSLGKIRFDVQSSDNLEDDFNYSALVPKRQREIFKTDPSISPEPRIEPSKSNSDIDCIPRIGISSSQDLAYLRNCTAELIKEQESPVYEQIQLIWDQLGFSVHQRLEMAAKYSKDLNESEKLQDALAIWKHSLNIVNNYDGEYGRCKSIIKMETSVRKQDMFNDQLKCLFEAETLLVLAADKLKTSFGDELIVQRRRSVDYIKYKMVKLTNLAMPLGLEFNAPKPRIRRQL